MASPFTPTPVKYFVTLLGRDPQHIRASAETLGTRMGGSSWHIDYASELFPFGHTTYYEPEMGPSLMRQFLSFAQPSDPIQLVRLKTVSAELELEYAHQGKRSINIDPGYMDLTKVVLASYKFGGQKLYVGEGVYADIVLLYAKGHFNSFIWTFPDFADGRYEPVLLKMRSIYKKSLSQATSC